MSAEVARAAAEATHAQGRLVLAHPTSVEGVRGALDAGVDILVHTTLGEESQWDADLVAAMAAKHMSVIPTFKVWRYELLKDRVPPEIIDKLVSATFDQLTAFRKREARSSSARTWATCVSTIQPTSMTPWRARV